MIYNLNEYTQQTTANSGRSPEIRKINPNTNAEPLTNGTALSWLDPTQIEREAALQAARAADLPYVHRVALMPDAHVGYGLPIGGVAAVKDGFLPYGIGSDQGCGMCAVDTGLNANDFSREEIGQILETIIQRIPVGKGKLRPNNRKTIDDVFPGERARQGIDSFGEIASIGVLAGICIDNMKRYMDTIPSLTSVLTRLSKQYIGALQSFDRSLGTLGAGNHFIELQIEANTNNLWVMIHSGSRSIGYTCCNFFWKLAEECNDLWYTATTDKKLVYLPASSAEGELFNTCLTYSLFFAKMNRLSLMLNTLACIPGISPECVDSLIDVYHNFASIENVDGHPYYVHRKGATAAFEDEPIIIPGSMQTYSIVGVGKGNEASMQSCSHGSGRRMSRTQAQKLFSDQITPDTTTLPSKAGQRSVVIRTPNVMKIVDELGDAYKPIDEVLVNQSDLIDINHFLLYPIGVVKG